MAIEVTFAIRGKETTQALYVQESEWEIPLTSLRQIIEEQSLYVPLEYKFLSLKDNAIAHPAEESIVVKDIVRYSYTQKDDIEPKLKLEDFGMASEIGENVIKKPSNPTIWITPLKVNFSSASPNSETTATGTGSSTEDGGAPSEGGGQQGREDDPLLGNESNADGRQTPGEQCSGCPYTIFMNFLHGQRGPHMKTVVKILFLLTCILFMMLATLTLTVHVMVSSFTSIGRSPAMSDLFSKLNGGFGESSEVVSELQLKLSELEMSSKYEIDQLKTRLAELEDLYLRDLAIHKKELNLIKKQMVLQDKDMFLGEDADDFGEDKDRNYDWGTKETKRKQAAGKMNERNKG